MRIVSIDIDPQGNHNRIHLGPFVAGLNAIFGTRGSGKSTIARFFKHLLYGRYRDRSGSDYRTPHEHVGSLQWADANGNSRVISTSDPIEINDYRFNGPYHWSTRHDWLSSNAIDTLKPSEQPWHRIGGETFDAVFCGRLGETLPERLWSAARELGIAIRFDLEDDETFRRLKAEERRLQERLHHLRVDDRDHAWWTAERRRLALRLEELHAHPQLAAGSQRPQLNSRTFQDRPVVQQWQSQLHEMRSRLSTCQRKETELAKLLADTRYSLERGPSAIEANDTTSRFDQQYRSTELRSDAYGSWVGYVDRLDDEPIYAHSSEPQVAASFAFESPASQKTRLEELEAERFTVRNEIETLHRGIRTLEDNLRNAHHETNVDATMSWEVEDLKKRLVYADEVLQSWTLYEQTRARLVELQSQLRGQGPYRSGLDSSFLKSIERYIRELSAGALRGLPTWAIEALRRDHSYVTGLSKNGRPESYREVYRDYRPDASAVDFTVPPSTSAERQIVELAIRLAIIDAASHRIGRLPLLLDDALDGFHGQQLDHIAQVLMQFARDGQQILLLTSEEEVAHRVRHHQGWVARLGGYLKNESTDSLDRAIDERYWRGKPELDYVAPAARLRSTAYEVEPAYAVRGVRPRNTEDVNALLAAHAVDFADVEAPSVRVDRYAQPDVFVADAQPATVKMPQFFLSEISRIEDAPGMKNGLATRLRRLGIERVAQFIETDPAWIADSAGASEFTASDFRALQRASMLMCCVPQLRAFDARVLVGCGIDNPTMLADMKPAQLVQRVESFLATDRGQAILRSGTSYELSRITTWIVSARRSLRNRDRSSRRSRDNDRRRYDREPAQRQYVTIKRPEQPAQTQTTRRTVEVERPVYANASATRAPQSTRQVTRTTTRTTSTTGHRFYLELDSNVVDAPTIGPRIAERLAPLGIVTVRDLLECNAASIAAQLGDKRFDDQTILDWQDQARLVCSVPNLRGHDAQILVGCDVRTADSLALQNVDGLLAKASSFVSSKLGQRTLRGAESPDRSEVTQWISWAKSSRSLAA
jgi:predicted flap endonuclease-1-like 5' DNA nuclease